MDAMSAALGDLGVLYLSLPLFPVFEMVHYAKVALIARSESGQCHYDISDYYHLFPYEWLWTV